MPGIEAVFEIPLRRILTAHTQNMRRKAFRRKRHVIPRTMPQILTLTEQVMDPESLIGVQPKGSEIEINPSRLRVEAIEIDDDDDYV